MALSGHQTPEAARLCMKRTDVQRAIGARKRRAWIEATKNVDTDPMPTRQPGTIGWQGANK